MRIRVVLVPAVLALFVLLAGCLAPLQGDGTAATAQNSNVTRVDVTGTGQASTDPDLAFVFVSVTAQADTADEARSRTAADVDRMRAALGDAGVPDDDVATTSFQIFPRYDASDRSAIVGYTAVHAFRVRVGPDRAGEVVDVAVGNGADRVDGVLFTVTEETRAELRDRALSNAVAAARADADTVAAATNLSITGVERASTSSRVVPAFETRFEGAGTSLEPGPVVVEASVSVTYTAE